MNIPTTEPTTIQAGATVKWRKTLSDFPANDGWTLTYQFRGPVNGLNQAATADGAAFLMTLATATTTPWAGGLWVWQAWAEKAGEKYLADSGQFTVTPALGATSAAHEARSQIKRTLDAIEAMIAGKATLDQEEYQIGDRMLRRYKLTELIELRREYAKLYAQEQQQAGQRDGKPLFKTIHTRFDPTC